MTALVVDTSAYSLFLGKQEDAMMAVQTAERLILPVMVLGELFYGFALGNRREQNRRELHDFLSSYRTLIVPITQATAEQYATIYAHLRRQGRPIPTNDIWIAASAVEHDAGLLTADRHFSHVPHIHVQLLTP